MTGVICPTYQSGFYSPDRGGRAKYPQLWRGATLSLSPCLGPTGLRLQDHSGRGNNGTLANMSEATAWIVSEGKHCLSFDGTNDSITIPTITTTKTFFLSVWIYPTGGADSYQSIITQGATQGVFMRSTRLIECYNSPGTTLSSVTALTLSAWNHLAVLTVAGVHQIYINGVLDASGGVLGSVNGWSLDTIGNDSSSETFQGYMDDLRINVGVCERGLVNIARLRRGIAYERSYYRAYNAPAAAPGGTSMNLLLLGVG